jgi:glycosyltransferase involved in cell wall biosynthesis
MKVLVTDNAHLYRTIDGKYYTPSIYGYEFFQRYLNVFDEVRFVSKTKHVDSIDKEKFLLLSCEGLEIYELPWYQGIRGLLKNIFKLTSKYRKVCDGCDCYIFRVAQIESYLTYIFAKRRKKPYALEVVNDPAAFTNMKGVFRWLNVNMLKFMIKKANGVAYVTQNYLQQLYPSRARREGESENYFESSYSSIDLSEGDIQKKHKKFQGSTSEFKIIHIANSIVGDLKGHKTLIKATKIVTEKGYNISVCFVGDGVSTSEFKEYANKLGITDNIHFIGRLHSKADVMKKLDESDLFVFPSYTEGLPRVIIEAQAVGLPCLATPVGGTPELLSEKYLFQPNDSENFAKMIIHLINNPDELEQMSKDNIVVAKKYTKEKLTEKRNRFYSKLYNISRNNLHMHG